jgi:hypothetical protein
MPSEKRVGTINMPRRGTVARRVYLATRPEVDLEISAFGELARAGELTRVSEPYGFFVVAALATDIAAASTRRHGTRPANSGGPCVCSRGIGGRHLWVSLGIAHARGRAHARSSPYTCA